MKQLLCICLIVSSLVAGCSHGENDIDQRRIQLHTLDEMSKAGPVQAVEAGTQALKLMDIKSFELADAAVSQAEREFIFEAFDSGLRFFETALQMDRGNSKANAYVAILKPFSHIKGMAWRTFTGSPEENNWQYYSMMRSFLNNTVHAVQSIEDFMNIPYKSPFMTDADIVEEVMGPLTKDVLATVPQWEYLASDPSLDITLFLPKIMASSEAIRIRTVDAKGAEELALALGFAGDAYTLYSPGKSSFTLKLDERINDDLSDPQFGLLTNPDFFKTFKGRSLELAQGMELLIKLLRDRKKSDENSPHDFFHLDRIIFSTCAPVDKDESYYMLQQIKNKCSKSNIMDTGEVLTLASSQGREFFEKKIPEHPGQDSEYLHDLVTVKRRIVYGTDFILSIAQTLREAAVGPTQLTRVCMDKTKGEIEDKKRTYWIDVPTYLQNPITDIKTLHPKIDEQGRITKLDDPTLHGLFPQGIPCNDYLGYKIFYRAF